MELTILLFLVALNIPIELEEHGCENKSLIICTSQSTLLLSENVLLITLWA